MHEDESHLNKAQKMVRMLDLMRNPNGISCGELMGRFDLDDRTMRRYLSNIRDLEIPLKEEGSGADRIIWLGDSYLRKDVKLSLLEMLSLHLGRTLFDFLDGTVFAEDMDMALEQISHLGNKHDNLLMADFDRKFMAVAEHKKDHSNSTDLLDEVLNAILRQYTVDAHYAKLTGPMKRYRLHPLTLVVFRQGLYLFAFDVNDQHIKTFALDRFRGFSSIKSEKFDYPPDYKPQDLVSDAFGIITGPVENVELHFNRRAAPYIRERIWHKSQQISAGPKGGVILTMHVGLAHELYSWIMSYGPDVKVVKPTSLAEQVKDAHLKAYQGWT